MNFSNRRPGTSTTFLDAASSEHILQLAADEDGTTFVAFHLYDAAGELVAESAGLQHYADGIAVHCEGGELLLSIPQDPHEPIQYRLYNRLGLLLTRSDGARTMIYAHLRMEGIARNWTHPFAHVEAARTTHRNEEGRHDHISAI